MMDIKPAKERFKDQGWLIGLMGVSGSGKSYAASTLPSEQTLVVDFENGGSTMSLSNCDVDSVVISNFEDLREFTKEIANTDYKIIYIDGFWGLSALLMDHIKKSEKLEGWQMYGRFNELATDFIKYMKTLLSGKTIIITFLSEEVIDNGIFRTRPNFPGQKLQNVIQAFFDVWINLHVSDDGVRTILTRSTSTIALKDRSGRLDPEEEADLGKLFKKISGDVK